MARLFSLRAVLFLSFLGIIPACAHQNISLRSVYQSNDCGLNQQTLKLIDTAEELTLFTAVLPLNFSGKKIQLNDIDFKKQALILFALGRKPSQGYRIEQYKNSAFIKDKKLHLPIRSHQPQKKHQQAQIITSPCQLFVIPRTKFSTLTIIKEPIK